MRSTKGWSQTNLFVSSGTGAASSTASTSVRAAATVPVSPTMSRTCWTASSTFMSMVELMCPSWSSSTPMAFSRGSRLMAPDPRSSLGSWSSTSSGALPDPSAAVSSALARPHVSAGRSAGEATASGRTRSIASLLSCSA